MKNTYVSGFVLCGALICWSAMPLAYGQSFADSLDAGSIVGTAALAASSAVSNPQDSGPYADGMRAIDAAHWAEAEAIFARNADQPGGEHPDGSLYWKAYAENKLGRRKEALDTCGQLVHKFAASKWIHECRALEIEVQAGLGHPVEPRSEGDDDLKLLALNALMLKDEPRALADLQEILSGDASEALKQRAKSILGQHYSDATYAEIVRIRSLEGDVRIARGEQNEKPAGAPWEQAVADLPLETGFSLTTGSNGRVEIELEDASTIYLAENSVLTFNDLHTTSGVPYTEVALLTGSLSLGIDSSISGEAFVLRTPTDDIAVRYPHRALFRVSSFTDGTAVTSRDVGGVSLPDVSPVKLLMGQMFTMRQGHMMEGPIPEDASFAEFDKWVTNRLAARIAAMTAVMKAAGLPSPLPGLADMAGKGTFFACPPYGTCWEPLAAQEPQQHAVRESRMPFFAGRQTSAHLVNASLQAPRFAAAQLRPDTLTDPFDDPFSACFPSAVRYHLLKDPLTGKTELFNAGLGGGAPSWGWGVCHAGAWVRVHKRHHYVWCAGQKRHHVEPVHWVKSGHNVGFVPVHPFDVQGRPAINGKEEIYAVHYQNSLLLQRIEFDPSHPLEMLKSPPREFRASFLRPLAKADVPQMEARSMLKVPVTVAKGAVGKDALAGTSRPVTMPIRFDAKSQSFMMSKTEVHGGKSVTVSEAISNRSGTLQARGESFSGGHGSSGGSAGGARGGGSSSGGGSTGGGHAGGSSTGSGGGSSTGSSSGSSGASSSGGHR